MNRTRPARTRIKICGITRIEDAMAAAHCGADAIGLVFYPASPRFVDVGRARDIVAALPPFVSRVGLFVDADPAEVDRVLTRVALDCLQFHGEESPQACEQHGVPFLKAVRVRPGLDLLEYADTYCAAAGLLLDAYVQGIPGGTGARFDWTLIPTALPRPVVLSGGLDADNVVDAVRQVRPWAVDVSSGVEASKGVKDSEKIWQFVCGVRDADL